MLVKNRKELPSLPRCPGELIAFFYLLPSQRHTHTPGAELHSSPTGGEEDVENHFSPPSHSSLRQPSSREPRASEASRVGKRNLVATADTPAVVWMHVSRQAEWVDDWAMREQVTQKFSSLPLPSSSFPPAPPPSCWASHWCSLWVTEMWPSRSFRHQRMQHLWIHWGKITWKSAELLWNIIFSKIGRKLASYDSWKESSCQNV